MIATARASSRHRVAPALALLAACGGLGFDVDQDVPEQTIEGSPLPGPLAQLFPLPLEVDLSAKIKAQETGPIDRVTLRSLHLDVTATARPAGDADDWGFVQHVDLYVESRQEGSTLPRLKVATVDAPGQVARLEFVPVEGVNLLPYVDQGARLIAEASGTVPPDAMSFDGRATFHVEPL